jgi:hypothetical protein
MEATTLTTRTMSVAILLATLVLSGCSDSGDEPERVVVSGKVTWQKNEVKDGIIRFICDSGPSAQGPIRDGSYLIDYKGGVPVGNCRVEVEGFEEQDIKDSGSTLIAMPKKVGIQIIPQQFNRESTLRVEIAAGKVNEHDFHLDVKR